MDEFNFLQFLINDSFTISKGCNKAITQFWAEIILLISNQTRSSRSFDFKTTRIISDQIVLQSVQLPSLKHARGHHNQCIFNGRVFLSYLLDACDYV